jgi:hypothetical protein
MACQILTSYLHLKVKERAQIKILKRNDQLHGQVANKRGGEPSGEKNAYS